MSTLLDAFAEWNRQVQLPGNISIDEATDILQTFGPTLTDQEGNDWWDATATEYGRLDIITPATYVGLRNYANNNEAGANDLFDALQQSITLLPETSPVQVAIDTQNNSDELAEIPGNITRIENLKSGGTSVADVQFDTALNEAIFSLQGLAAQLTG